MAIPTIENGSLSADRNFTAAERADITTPEPFSNAIFVEPMAARKIHSFTVEIYIAQTHCALSRLIWTKRLHIHLSPREVTKIFRLSWS